MFHTALKFSWIKQLIVDTGDWQHLFEKQYDCNKKVFWVKDEKTLLNVSKNTSNKFWAEIF